MCIHLMKLEEVSNNMKIVQKRFDVEIESISFYSNEKKIDTKVNNVPVIFLSRIEEMINVIFGHPTRIVEITNVTEENDCCNIIIRTHITKLEKTGITLKKE